MRSSHDPQQADHPTCAAAAVSRPPKGAQAIRNRVAEADRQEGRRQPKSVEPALSAAEREEFVRLRREVRQLELERDILSRATAPLASF